MSTQDTSSERRQFTRISFDANTVIRLNDTAYKVQLADISFKGLLLTSEDTLPLSTNDNILVEVHLGDLTLEMPAFLTHHENGHYGFRMEHLDIDTMTHLRRLVELNLGDETLFERELEQLLPMG